MPLVFRPEDAYTCECGTRWWALNGHPLASIPVAKPSCETCEELLIELSEYQEKESECQISTTDNPSCV